MLKDKNILNAFHERLISLITNNNNINNNSINNTINSNNYANNN